MAENHDHYLHGQPKKDDRLLKRSDQSLVDPRILGVLLDPT